MRKCDLRQECHIEATPTEKKDHEKKSRSGFRLMAMYWAIGLLAMLMPAIKAPIQLAPSKWRALPSRDTSQSITEKYTRDNGQNA